MKKRSCELLTIGLFLLSISLSPAELPHPEMNASPQRLSAIWRNWWRNRKSRDKN